MGKYMGQIMAECDCQHQACKMRGYCMAARIEELELAVRYEADLAQQALDAREELEAKLSKAFIVLADLYRLHLRRGPAWDHAGTKEVMDSACAIIAAQKGQDYE